MVLLVFDCIVLYCVFEDVMWGMVYFLEVFVLD